MIKNISTKKGYSLIEIIVSIGILSLIILAVSQFQKDIFSFGKIISAGLDVQYEIKKIIRPFANEVRSAVPSELGGYPIFSAGTSTFGFYTDIDNDGTVEKVRYFLDGKDFKKGVTKPSGNPLVYSSSNENVIHVVRNVKTDVPIFYYYDSYYDGTSSSTPLTSPVSPIDVRLIKVELMVDDDSLNGKNVSVTTQVTLRNLKDNL